MLSSDRELQEAKVALDKLVHGRAMPSLVLDKLVRLCEKQAEQIKDLDARYREHYHSHEGRLIDRNFQK